MMRSISLAFFAILIATPVVAQDNANRFDGAWYSPEWKYGYRLTNGFGIATESNSPRFRRGEVIVMIHATGPNSFAGEQMYRDGRWYKIQGILGSDDRLHIKGERNVAWSMQREEPAQPPVVRDRNVQMSNSPVAEQIRNQYRTIKTVADALDRRNQKTWRRPRPNEHIELGSCGAEFENIGTSQLDATSNLVLLATEVVRLGNQLLWVGYPRSVMRALDEWERNTIEATINASDDPSKLDRVYFQSEPPMDELVGNLALYRRSHPNLPLITIETACGGHAIAVEVSLVTQPRGGAVFLIPVFFYELCRAQKQDPDDTARCGRWQEAITGTKTEVLGDYHYVARWSDGAIRRGKLSFNGTETGRTITLRRP